MNLLSLIQSKKAGVPLSTAQMDWLISSSVAGTVPDYQLATLLTVICYEGLEAAETLAMTRAFVDSGDTLSWEGISRPVVDKHSTGGVGDKVTLALAPLLAAAGLAMPKMSGRGLGHTGGTIDKLESIPGFRTDLSMQEFRSILQDVGCAVAGQTAHLVPADKIFYALRDATDNIRELGLVTASVMSKKLAAGAPCIVLDVKCGSGAFFRDEAEARAFASQAMAIGRAFGRQVACVLTDMDQPLGQAVGNRIEVLEVLDLISGSGKLADLREVLLALGSVELLLCGMCPDMESGRVQLQELLDSGVVKQKFREWIRAQGGRLSELPASPEVLPNMRSVAVQAGSPGWVSGIDCLQLGNVARRCGAGRMSREEVIEPDAGLMCYVAIGERIEQGEELARLLIHESRAAEADELLAMTQAAFQVSTDGSVPRRKTVLDILLP